jgi:two-component system cell cycle response regulator CtrA
MMLAKENLLCEVTDLGRDNLLLDRLYDYDIILLHLMVPDIEGCKLLQKLRAARVNTPILILSDRGDVDEKVKFLRSGADDVMTRPFDRRELIARILAIVRRSKGHCASTIRTGKLSVNLDTRGVSVDDRPVRLTPKEYGILELLSLRKGAILRKGMFLDHLYGGMNEPQPKMVDILVCTLRKKLGRAAGDGYCIETVRGCGYVLRELATTPVAATMGVPEDYSARLSDVDKRAAAGGVVRQSCRLRPEGARPADPIDQQPGIRDRPTRLLRASAIGHGVKPKPASFPVEVRFEDAVTSDGGPLRVLQPNPVASLFERTSARHDG